MNLALNVIAAAVEAAVAVVVFSFAAAQRK